MAAIAILAAGLFAQTPATPDAWAKQGVERLRAGQTAEAIAALRNAAAARPQNAEYRFFLGLALYQAGQTNLAREELAKVLAANANDARALHLDGLCLLKLGKLREGAGTLESSLKANPANPPAALTLATTRVSLGDVDEAEQLLRGPLAAAPPAARKLVRGMILNAKGRYREAEQILAEAAREDPKLPMVRNQLGYTLMLLGDYPAAIRQFESELRLVPGDFQASANLAWILVQEREFDKAAPLLEQAIRQRPDSPGLHYLVAQVSLHRREVDQAREALERAIALQPDFRAAHVLLARVYARQNRRDDAARQQAIIAQLTADEQKRNLGGSQSYGGSVSPPGFGASGGRP